MLVFVFPAGLQKIQTIQLEIIIGVDYFTDVLLARNWFRLLALPFFFIYRRICRYGATVGQFFKINVRIFYTKRAANPAIQTFL